jgi:hypothetical protein
MCDGRMHALVFYELTHRAVAGHSQTVFLTVDAVDQIEQDLGFEGGYLFSLSMSLSPKVVGLAVRQNLQVETGLHQ